MGSDEEYLDNLLKSLMGDEEEGDPEAEASSGEKAGLELFGDMALPELDMSLADLDLAIQESGAADEAFFDEFALVDSDIDDMSEESEHVQQADDLMITDGLDTFAIDDLTDEFFIQKEEQPKEQEMDQEVLDLLEGISQEESKKESSKEEGRREESSKEILDNMDELEAALFAPPVLPEVSEPAEAVSFSEEEPKKGTKEKKKKKKGKSAAKKKGKASGTTGENGEAEEGMEAASAQKKGFFGKMLEFLTETDEDEEEEAASGLVPSDENKDVLKQLKAEDKKKKKKKMKGKKIEEAAEEGEDSEESGSDKKSKKKKRKKVQEEVPVIIEELPPTKKISKKNVGIIAGICVTLAASILVLCVTVPSFFDRREARDAYYESDYAKSFDLLYGKRLDNSDSIIYNKSKIIMELNRKLDSYHNYMGMNEEVYALDALMSGVQKYPDLLLEAEEYHITSDVNAIYETLLNILSDKYDISESTAKVIIGYDDLTYTRKLESIVHGTPFVMPGEEEMVATGGVVNLLPEEEFILREQEAVEEDTQEIVDPSEAQEAEELIEEVETVELPVVSEPETNEEQLTVDTIVIPVSGSSSGSQGEQIQGIRQPINVKINY